ncbi:MAG: hypothetical protein R2762_10525 [Bryobacteraceae bacterium]
MPVLPAVVLLLTILPLAAQPQQSYFRPSLLFREDWKETPAEKPVTAGHLANPNLILSLHGPGKTGIKKSHHDKPADDPFYIWSGEAPANWAVSLRHKAGPVDLSGQARIRWRSKQAGFRLLRLILQLADGTWLIGDQFDPPSVDWREHEFILAGIRWRQLRIGPISESKWVEKPNLARVSEIGFTDLMPGGGSDACSRLDWIEVYGRLAQ